LDTKATGGLGEIRISHPPGTFALTPASIISVQAIGKNQHLLGGLGIDWGTGTGCLALAAAKIPGVTQVFGLDISEANVAAARKNALENEVAHKVTFIRSDSYSPFLEAERELLEAVAGQVHFILANPSASEDDDGLGYRRAVLWGARKYLIHGGVVFLSISSQYGMQRIRRLAEEIPEFLYDGILASTDWVPFDLSRSDLRRWLELYAREERRGGLDYVFRHPQAPRSEPMNAKSALAHFYRTGESPLMKWQSHLFRYER
jgi:SAM-dependent methyltransferase